MKRLSQQMSKVGLVGVLCTFFTTGCVHDMYYEPAKVKDYSFTPSLGDATPREAVAAVDDASLESPARYTSSTRAVRERPQDPNILGSLHLKTSNNPQDEGVKFAIRKDYRAYTAETPLGEGFEVNGHKVTPNFALGAHKDHKGMVGIVFRMPF